MTLLVGYCTLAVFTYALLPLVVRWRIGSYQRTERALAAVCWPLTAPVALWYSVADSDRFEKVGAR